MVNAIERAIAAQRNPGLTPISRIDAPVAVSEPGPHPAQSASRSGTIDLTDEFRRALSILNHGGSMFLTGKAGTGKSTLIRYFMAHTRRKVVVVAPTGIAALNVGGLTIHRLFSFGPSTTLDDVQTGHYRPGRFAEVIKGMQTLIIDEASMVRADLFDRVEAALRRFGRRPGKPFGGVQVVLVGDLLQLPPVVTDPERAWLEGLYETPYFFSAKAFTRKAFPTVQLTTVFRQLGDQRLTDLLNAVREGVLVDEMRDELNTRTDADFIPPDDEFWLRVAPTNRVVTARNRKALERLDGRLYVHDATVTGDISTFDAPVEDRVEFKIGAQVMLLNNDDRGRWVNGSLGKITGVADDGATVLVALNGGETVDVRPYSWDVTIPQVAGGAMRRVPVGTFTQLPIKLAWAITIHKVQGQTLDRLIVDLTGGTFDYGQVYVALSRATSMNGIVLTRNVLAKDLRTDRRVLRFLAEATQHVAERHVGVGVLTVGAEDRWSRPRPIEIALAFDDGTSLSTLINPERDQSGAREAYGITVDDTALAPKLVEAWSVLARLVKGMTPIGVGIDESLGTIDFELKRQGLVHALPLGINLDPETLTPGERAECEAPTALRRARAALAAHQRLGGSGGTTFAPPEFDEQMSYLLSRDDFAVPRSDPALGELLTISQILSGAILKAKTPQTAFDVDKGIVRAAIAARLASVIGNSAGLAPSLIERLRLLEPLLGEAVVPAETASTTTDLSQVVFLGARVCFTGDAFDMHGRPLARAELKRYTTSIGLIPVESVTKSGCDLLVAAELGTQSNKARAAAKWGKPVISVSQFLQAQIRPEHPAEVPSPQRPQNPTNNLRNEPQGLLHG
ncbi:AAA family ATPase [Propionibacterium cyclohexanicum]|nr:AAA family ATPase [Propionibacterium cyclohexanicum]